MRRGSLDRPLALCWRCRCTVREGRQEARQTLAAAVLAHDWRPHLCGNQDAWVFHVLRREAEHLILPNLAELLAGTIQPRDNDERCALVGICQFTDRTVALARLYADAFSADPSLTETSRGHRYSAARAAARAGAGGTARMLLNSGRLSGPCRTGARSIGFGRNWLGTARRSTTP